ncbi:MAG: RdgB/HAM1 family non-canonical purine NTP pyrophosphatase [Clostridia bacterium]|nr:RdgB/HAM1 family non-canonical purine NTP pyrophosphatase [Clostridia bacterium]MBO7738438.1 RdgB/HAM1 family non-canonical purine NTP pyrophosphatase [Clostridia bacterium]
MELVFATNNKHKVSELRELFRGYFGDKVNILTLKDVGFEGDIIEDADTFAGNAFIKADTVCRFCGKPAVADDSGLVVDALGGAPGVMSARYSGADADDIRNIQKLLKELEGVEYENRTARFVCHICCVFPDGKRIDCEENSEGRIIFECKGDGDFGYDPVFLNEEYGLTFAQMDMETKNEVSHRGKAVRTFADIFASTNVDIIQ